MLFIRKIALLLVAALGLALPGTAAADVTVIHIPVDDTLTACNQLDPIHLTGSYTIIYSNSTTPAGGSSSRSFRIEADVRGVNLATGTPYVGALELVRVVNDTPSGVQTFTMNTFIQLQATDGGESDTMRAVFHMTTTADGAVRAWVSNFERSCTLP